MISVVKPESMKFPDRVLVTEGMFKAAQWTAWKHSWAISVQGVNNIKGIGTELAHIEKQTGKLKEVLIGFDADLIDNKHVFDAEVKLRKLLEKTTAEDMKTLAGGVIRSAVREYGRNDDMTALAVKVEVRQ